MTKGLITYLLFVVSIIVIFFTSTDTSPKKNKQDLNIEASGEVNVPKSIIMYEMLEKYSDIYEIPKYIAYNIAYRETRYKGPFHWDYVPEQGSSAGALGPMQIMPATGKSIYRIMGYDDEITNEDIRNNIELNVMISMKILRRSYNKIGNWAIVCGKYNTGQLIVNEYGSYCSSKKDYKSNWVNYE